jgi:hypothetical protein
MNVKITNISITDRKEDNTICGVIGKPKPVYRFRLIPNDINLEYYVLLINGIDNGKQIKGSVNISQITDILKGSTDNTLVIKNGCIILDETIELS